MLEFVKLTDDEKLLVTEGIELHQDLIEKLANVPTPAGPTPRDIEANKQSGEKLIPGAKWSTIKSLNSGNNNNLLGVTAISSKVVWAVGVFFVC